MSEKGFQLGDRIKQNADCPRSNMRIRNGDFRLGTVIGFGRKPHLIRVRYDGDSVNTVNCVHESFIDLVAAK